MTLSQRVEAAAAALVAIARDHPPAVLASSFGAEDMVLLDLVAEHAPSIGVFTLDTGRLPEETLVLIDRARDRYGLRSRSISRMPRGSSVSCASAGSTRSTRVSRCARPAAPFARPNPLLARCRPRCVDHRAAARAVRDATDLPYREFDTLHGLPKFNPLVDWTEEDVWTYVRARQVPYNALHDHGYRSIGCAPCTRAVEPGEDVRAGRWWWENPEHKECGLHRRPIGFVRKAAQTQEEATT
jgi:phosphoadenosine phosphosulfate reductase